MCKKNDSTDVQRKGKPNCYDVVVTDPQQQRFAIVPEGTKPSPDELNVSGDHGHHGQHGNGKTKQKQYKKC